MALTNYEPWSLIDRLQHQLNRYNESGNVDSDYSNVVTSHWRPAVDIKEEQDRFLITDITMERGILSIKGERSSESKQEEDGYTRVERVSGAFYRRFSLPDTADAERIEATGKDGVLTIVLPKHENVQPRRIEVKS